MLPYASYESADVLQEDDKSEQKAIEEEQPTQEDVALMKEVHELVSKEKIFKNADLTLDLMAKQMSINRNYLSKAINQTTGKNFNTYINEYRVKEAIKILSNEKSDVISIDAIAFDVGFNRMTACCNQDMISGNVFAVDLDGMGIDEFCEALYDFDAIFRQIIIVGAVNVFDVLLTTID